jgi:hypothetical protein
MEQGINRMNAIAKAILFSGLCAASSAGGTAADAQTAQIWQAKWKPQYASAPPAVQQWYRSQRNSRGGFCCDQADGDAYYGSYQLNADGSVTLGDGTRIPKMAGSVRQQPDRPCRLVALQERDQLLLFARTADLVLHAGRVPAP